MKLIPNAPFDFTEMLKRPLSRPSKVVAIDTAASAYSTVIRLPDRLVPVTVTGTGSADTPVLEVQYPESLSPEEQIGIMNRIRHIFSIDTNLTEFYEVVASDDKWAHITSLLRGLRPIQDADLFESMVRIIIGQQLNVKFAATLVERLVDLHAHAVSWQGMQLPVFPPAEEVARWSYDDLRSRSFSQRKAEYVIDFARSVVNKKIDLEQLWTMPDEQVYGELMPLRGIGRWTVECFLIFALGRPDLIPAADIGVQNAVKKLYNLSYRPKEEEVRKSAESWSPYRSLATYYLWQTLIRE